MTTEERIERVDAAYRSGVIRRRVIRKIVLIAILWVIGAALGVSITYCILIPFGFNTLANAVCLNIACILVIALYAWIKNKRNARQASGYYAGGNEAQGS
jgi:hypothetical protein